MNGPSSAPRGERPGTRGTRWETVLTSTKVVVDDDTWNEELPAANRETRRAIARKQRGKRNSAQR
ncbi:hypothetical protein [Streptomyces scabiei]|uniref:hypothetical protein n=1 Tax=Streptomyces scabiei TaxID=1930 RepID=UPI0007660BD0|nr:hypothetical protein [Streptomyces scabiei]